jgi:hypothetical protein
VNVADTGTDWKKAGRHLALWVLGAVLGTLLIVPVLALAGAFVRIPGMQAILDRIFTPNLDAVLMWVLLVSSWMLGVIAIYAGVTYLRGSRRVDNGAE